VNPVAVIGLLTAVMVAAGTVLLIFDETGAGIVGFGFGVFAFVLLLSMVISDAQTRKKT
jgi:hypothetical protein